MEDQNALRALGLKRDEALNADIDLRMTDFLEFYEHFEEESQREMVIRIARAAFGMGYCEAYRDARPGSLLTDHGYDIPAQRST